MAVTLGLNIPSLRAQRKLAETSSALAASFERIAGGQRINKASDDAAGLAIAESLNKDTRVYSQGIRNVNDGISALNLAQGALEQLAGISIRQKELAEQAANGVYTLTQRRALNAEANALVDEYNRIVQSTSFNQQKLTDKSLQELRIQAGYGVDGSVAFAIGEELARTVGDGSFGAETAVPAAGDSVNSVALGDVNGDQTLDMAIVQYSGYGSDLRLRIGRGDGGFNASTAFWPGAAPEFALFADVDGNGAQDIVSANGSSLGVLPGNGNGTFEAARVYATGTGCRFVAAGDLNGDGAQDLVTTESNGGIAGVYIGNGNGSFRARLSFATGAWPMAVALGDVNGDETLDFITSDRQHDSISVFIGKGDGTFFNRTSFLAGDAPESIALGDLNNDGLLDAVTSDQSGDSASVLIGNGDGSFRAKTSFSTGDAPAFVRLGDLNNDGYLDMAVTTAALSSPAVSIFLGNGNGSFDARSSYPTSASPGRMALGDLNNDGALDMAVGEGNVAVVGIFLANTQRVTTTAHLNLCTRQGALDALGAIDHTLERISHELGAIGSTQSRLQVTLNTLAISRETAAAAAGRIQDADMAGESSALLRTQMLQQAASAVLAQANQQPALALGLLRGR